jgi:glycosyltransferase involved in cell wall biosynthesis
MRISPMDLGHKVGIVAIGRNEGSRLQTCLRSVLTVTRWIIYVDSGSTDGSVELARRIGVEVVRLEPTARFTAALARNAGLRRLTEIAPDIPYVQFVDGDCEIAPDWIARGTGFLDAHSDTAVVCGRLRERHPERSVYNMLCDMEWDIPAGESRSCGGNALMRIAAVAPINGFRSDLIAGEESELCLRLRVAGWNVWRLDCEMALHDAAIVRFSQWWRRAQRTGYSYALGVSLHGRGHARHRIRESLSTWLWSVGVPLLALCCLAIIGWAGLLLLVLYPLQIARLAFRGSRSMRENWWRGLFLVVGKFAEAVGQVQFLAHRFRGQPPRLIEYK